MYLAAGAPGYTEEALPSAQPSMQKPQHQQQQPSPPPPLSADSTRALSAAPLGRIVRISTAQVPTKSLPSFLSTWRLLALPAYSAVPGCVSARVLLGESEDEGARGTGDKGPRGGLKAVAVVTEWATAADCEALASTPASALPAAYTSAMQQLAGHFRGQVHVATYGQDPEHVLGKGRQQGLE